jgi:hypothetical protein
MALLDHKATDLREAIQNLDPKHSLSVDELGRYFIERDRSPIKRIANDLDVVYPQKILFTGHRGSGKGTELSKLEKLLGDTFFIVRYTVERVLDLHDLTYVDVLLSMAIQMGESVERAKLKLKPETQKLLERLWSFGQEVEQETGKDKTREISGEVGVTGALASLLNLGLSFRREATTRQSLREKVRYRISDLLEGIDHLARDIEGQTKRKVLCIVEDLDKTDLAVSKEIFYDHGQSISDPPVSIIYTFPVALGHSQEFTQVRGFFNATHTLPNFKLHHKDGTDGQLSGKNQLEQLLLCRVAEPLFEKEARDLLVEYSGGLPRQFILLARDACSEARSLDATTVTLDHVKAAIARERNLYRRMLSKSQLESLENIHKDKAMDQIEDNRTLLHNLSVLEYSNDDDWYDVNPIVRDLLE